MARLTCIYCGSVIRRSDTKCPYCGAETESSIKKLTETRKAETEKHKELLLNLYNSRRKCVIGLFSISLAFVMLLVLLLMFIRPLTVKIIIAFLLVLTYACCLVKGIKDINKNNTESNDLHNLIDGLSHNIIFDCEEVQPYKMINDAKGIANDGCFKEGFQQIAFKVNITNCVSHKIEFKLVDEFFGKDNQFGYHVRLNADGVRMEDCKLIPFFSHHEENNKSFAPALYTEGFQKIVLRPQDTITGWVAFYVTPDAADLELLFADDYVMMKNPCRSIFS